MDASLNIQIQSRKLIKPSNPTPSHLRNYKLSLFDQLAPPGYVNLILYYHHNNRTQELEISLSEALTHFYPLAGRYVGDGLFVDCGDQGVDFLEARVVGSKLAEFLGLVGLPKSGLLNEFMPWDIGSADSDTSPMLAIQINVFDCGGIAMGLRVSHIVADASTIAAFLNGWALANRAGIGEVIRPAFNLFASLFPARTLPAVDHPHLSRSTETKFLTKRFVFDGSTISKLKAAKADKHRTPSRVLVVTALVWKALIGVAKSKHGRFRDSVLATSMSLRGKTALPVPENSFGNFWMSICVRFMAEAYENDQVEVNDLVGILETSLRGTAAECGKTASSDEIASMVIESYTKILEEQLREDDQVDIFIFTSWCRFPIHEADFGWGKPCWVSRVSRAFQVVNLIDSEGGDGIEAWVSLKETDMVEFERDQDIIAFSSL